MYVLVRREQKVPFSSQTNHGLSTTSRFAVELLARKANKTLTKEREPDAKIGATETKEIGPYPPWWSLHCAMNDSRAVTNAKQLFGVSKERDTTIINSANENFNHRVVLGLSVKGRYSTSA